MGAVVLDRNGVRLSEGHRNQDAPRKQTGSHAEVVALNNLSPAKKLRANTIVTTLEPCSLRTNRDMIPCSRRIIRAGIHRVYIGCLDPGVGVRGHGAQVLQDRGVYFTMFPEELWSLVKQYNEDYLREYGQRPAKPDKMPPYDLNKAPNESLEFLKSVKFRNFVNPIYTEYRRDFRRRFVKWEHFFATQAVESGVLERKLTRSREGTVFEQLASYLAIAPDDNEGKQDVYKRVGEWWEKQS